MTQHVPAWKKLGLKLKYAKDTADDASNQLPATLKSALDNGAPHGGFKRSRDEDSERQDSRSKKRKTHTKSKTSPQHPISETDVATTSSKGLGIYTEDGNTVISNANSAPLLVQETNRKDADSHSVPGDRIAVNESSESSRMLRKAPSRKKSVTFTPETKEEDGDSISTLFKAWSAEQQQQQQVPHTPPKPSKELPAESPSRPKESKVKQKRSEKPSAQAASVYLQYLDQFKNDKRNWKFNKSKQNDLLKNIWNIFRIPPSYNEALISYITGLQGAAARQRIANGAEDILKDITEKSGGLPTAEQMDDAEARKAAYSGALQRRIQQYEASGGSLNQYDDLQLDQTRQEIEQGKRAEAILRQVLIPIVDASWKPPPPPEPPQQQATSSGKYMKFADEPTTETGTIKAANPPRRKRKARTNVSSSSESSSSESESESSASSDSDSGSDSSNGSTSGSESDSDSSSDGSSGPEDDSESDSENDSSDESPASISEAASKTPMPKHKDIFDSDLLDQAFPTTAARQKSK